MGLPSALHPLSDTGQVQPRSESESQIELSPSVQVQSLLGALTAIVFTVVYQHPDTWITSTRGSFATDIISMRALFRLYIVLVGGLLASFLLQPLATWFLQRLRLRLSAAAKRVAIVLSLLLSAALLSFFLVSWGRHQFGAWDYAILIDLAWRQFGGQQPYIDFVTPTPPLFNWTAALAFQVFGVTWNANLYLAAVFSCATLVWSYLLLRNLGLHPPAALGTSLCVQVAAMLSCSFWWYNNSTLVLAALFYATSLLLLRSPSSRLAQVSFVLLTALLPLAKPNIAGLVLVGCLALLLFCSPARWRILLLFLLGIACCIVFSLTVMHVSWPAMMATYRGISRERGAASAFGYQSLTVGERRMTLLWIVVLCLPLLSAWQPLQLNLRKHQWRQAAFWLLFPLAVIVTAYGIAGNGEWRSVDCTLLIIALASLAFLLRADSPLLQRSVTALLCGMLATDLYVGATRLRVFTVGVHHYFEWTDNEHRFPSGFLQDLRASETMVDVDQEVRDAVRTNSGPFFLGPRVDFEYPALNLPSPTHWTTFFQPGTAFDRKQSAALVAAWKAHRFPTLIFLKDEYTFYPEDLIHELNTRYVRDDHYPWVAVYRRIPELLADHLQP